ncbi:sulfite oxidase [Advenella mimigardefordensis]|uniref:Putative sulfite oxidase n=1 Tax=Advenella mimigardefordensis (strain DSM 17166 / LMG 22922 / DPN7) TaxID=1247726 RepID=W0PBQ4_ADVMD|nr:sulfite oxidase [Advenella mimigardefordensis]AHG62478.1 putative sulfite oxidase [Advenella mimigardefordensis DPN7]
MPRHATVNPQRRTRLIQALAFALSAASNKLLAAPADARAPASDAKTNAATKTPSTAATPPSPATASPSSPLPPPAEPAPLPENLAWKDADSLLVHNPHAIETRRAVPGRQLITPTECLFVRDNALPPPARLLAEAEQWPVAFDGVAQPDAYTLAELQAMPTRTIATVLQCAENGRALQSNPAIGTQWQTGGAGCVIWTGVPLTTVIHELGGAVPGSRFITATGADSLPDGIPSDFTRVERSVPLSALDNALLAWTLNGAPIPLVHGGPLRLVLPGYASINYIKYVRRIAFTAEESSAHIQTADFRVPLRPGEPKLTIPAWRLPVKSWITEPLGMDAPVKAGAVPIRGVAMGGASAVTHIEVSADGGATWHAARFTGSDLGPFAWRLFDISLHLPPGPVKLACRATNAAGQQQPELTTDNTGYFVNGWREHQISLTVAPAG